MKILLVEDDITLSKSLVELLNANHYSVDLAYDGQTGLDLAMSDRHDLIVLDWLVPQLDGVLLCRRLRAAGYHKPILLLSAKNYHTDIVAGLDSGADAYVTKPYDAKALLARIRSLLRRSGVLAPSTLNWENLCLDQISSTVTYNDCYIPLTVTEYKLLELFLQHPHRIFSRRMILNRLWEDENTPLENAVTSHVKDLRKKLKAGGLTGEILETVYGLGYKLKPVIETSVTDYSVTSDQKESEKSPQTKKDLTSVNRVLKKFGNSFHEQIAVLEQAKTALLAGDLSDDLQQLALQEAHKMVGSLGAFGYSEGSRVARSLEYLLIQGQPLVNDKIDKFSQLVTALQEELTKPPVTLTVLAPPSPRSYRVLTIDDDTMFAAQLLAEASSWGIYMEIAPDLTTARSRLAVATPDAILLDLTFPNTEEDGLKLLPELVEQWPNLPIIVLTARNTLAERLAVLRSGARKFLHKPIITQQIFQTLVSILPQPHTLEAKVLIVDDDPAMLTHLSALLTPWGLDVTTLTDLQEFWEVLIATSPDLAILDLEMPVANGLELCQILRQDPQWSKLPILVVTAHNDTEFLERAFAAGADDFISKPVLGSELVTRVISRIERVRTHLQAGRRNQR